MTKQIGLLDVGKHCDFCRQNDFLPFYCDDCNKYFCSSHRHKESHHCEWLLKQEKQKKVVAVETISSGNEKYFASLLPQKSYIRIKQANNSNSYPASNINVTIKSQILKQGDYGTLNKLKRFFEKNRFMNIDMSSKVSSSNKSAQLMKMKKTAKGEVKIPPNNRVYIWCYYIECSDSNPTKHDIYINKNWPVGKALDSIAQILCVKNLNSQHNVISDERLFLYINCDKSVVLLETSQRVNDTVRNGDILFLVRGQYTNIQPISK